MIAFFAVFVHHVPQYDGCDHKCCHLPHGPDHQPGGLPARQRRRRVRPARAHGEESSTSTSSSRSDYEHSLVSITWGAEAAPVEKPFHWDEPLSLPLDLPKTYPPASLRPFTQHAYYELLPEGAARQSRPRALANCTSHHASVRLIVHDNAPRTSCGARSSAATGLECERFTFIELMSFPIYVIRNHGRVWNDAAWTLPFFMVLVAVLMALLLWWWWEGALVFYRPVGPSFPRQLQEMRPGSRWSELKAVCWVQEPRTLFYAVATWAVVVDIFETTAHALIAARDVPAGDDGYTWFIGVYGVRWLLLVFVAVPWASTREVPESLWRSFKFKKACGSRYDGFGRSSPYWAQGFWSLADIAIGVLALLLLAWASTSCPWPQSWRDCCALRSG